MTAETISMLPAVDRFGCMRISRNIVPGMMNSGASPVKKRLRFLDFMLSARARNRIDAYFASSDG